MPRSRDCSHGILPVPYAGQTITIKNLDGVRKGGQQVARPGGVDGKTWEVSSQTPSHTPFSMGPFNGAVETIDLGGTGNPGEEAVAYVCRNFDGNHGVTTAASMEGCLGKDTFVRTSTRALSFKIALPESSLWHAHSTCL